MKVKISNGNKKLGKTVTNISLPPIKSCEDNIPCSKYCYALKAYRCYKNTKNAWDLNLKIYNTKPYQYFTDIRDYLANKKPNYFRWHVSGDIPDKWYLDQVISIANSFKGTKFLAFTKKYYLFDNVKIPKNLSIVFSAWPGYPLPKQKRYPIAYMQDGTETRVHNAIECPGNCETCGICWSLKQIGKNVVFKKH